MRFIFVGLIAALTTALSIGTAQAVGGSVAQGPNALTYDSAVHVYDAATSSVQSHTSEAAPAASDDVSQDLQGSVATATAPLSVLLRLSVAANTAPRFVATADGTIIDTQAPALAQQIDDVVTSLRSTGQPPGGVYQGGYNGQTGVYANLGGDLPPQPIGYYTESGVWPGAPGTERIVIGQQPGEVWYSPDHYGTFRSWP